VLAEAEHLLDLAESTGVIPQPLVNDYRSRKAETVRTVPISLTCWARAVAQYHIDDRTV
jgi:hypothetical protein